MLMAAVALRALTLVRGDEWLAHGRHGARYGRRPTWPPRGEEGGSQWTRGYPPGIGWFGRLTSGIFPRNGGEDVRCTGLVEAAPPMAG